jgi:hypothetical protein
MVEHDLPVPRGRDRWVLLGLLLPSLLLPVVGLVDRGLFVRGDEQAERPLSWQMYSLVSAPVRYDLELDDGRRIVVDPDTVAGSVVRRMHYGPTIPERLCQAEPDAVLVVRTGWNGVEEFSC